MSTVLFFLVVELLCLRLSDQLTAINKSNMGRGGTYQYPTQKQKTKPFCFCGSCQQTHNSVLHWLFVASVGKLWSSLASCGQSWPMALISVVIVS